MGSLQRRPSNSKGWELTTTTTTQSKKKIATTTTASATTTTASATIIIAAATITQTLKKHKATRKGRVYTCGDLILIHVSQY